MNKGITSPSARCDENHSIPSLTLPYFRAGKTYQQAKRKEICHYNKHLALLNLTLPVFYRIEMLLALPTKHFLEIWTYNVIFCYKETLPVANFCVCVLATDLTSGVRWLRAVLPTI